MLNVDPDPLTPPPSHIMLDLETWGTGNKAVPVSIGAVRFDANEILDRFHVAIDPASCQLHGLEMDASTILWWLDPERDEARRDWLRMERVDLGSALNGFALWVQSAPTLAIWGNGSTFDNVILRGAYAAAGLDYPVKFRQDYCYRTMKAQSAVTMVREGTHHNALDDALSQAKHLQAIWREQDTSGYRSMLEKCASQFHFYEAQHRAKGTPEADDKAKVNAGFVTDIRQLLDGGPNKS